MSANVGGAARTVLDATIMVTPATDQGLPLQLGPGQLTVRARLADDTVDAPTVFHLRADHNADPAATIEMGLSREVATRTVELAGGIYACNLHVNAPTPKNATLADVAHQAQFVEVQITYAPS
jgi:hypothetical protein